MMQWGVHHDKRKSKSVLVVHAAVHRKGTDRLLHARHRFDGSTSCVGWHSQQALGPCCCGRVDRMLYRNVAQACKVRPVWCVHTLIVWSNILGGRATSGVSRG
jgi:hypothetical protein